MAYRILIGRYIQVAVTSLVRLYKQVTDEEMQSCNLTFHFLKNWEACGVCDENEEENKK